MESTLENHSHFPAERFLFLLSHGEEVAVVIQQFSFVRCQQTHDTFHEYGFSRTALPYNQVGLSILESGIDIFQYLFFFK